MTILFWESGLDFAITDEVSFLSPLSFWIYEMTYIEAHVSNKQTKCPQHFYWHSVILIHNFIRILKQEDFTSKVTVFSSACLALINITEF